MVEAFEDSVSQSIDIFKELLNFHHPLPNRKLTRKKSIIIMDPSPGVYMENQNTNLRNSLIIKSATGKSRSIFGRDGLEYDEIIDDFKEKSLDFDKKAGKIIASQNYFDLNEDFYHKINLEEKIKQSSKIYFNEEQIKGLNIDSVNEIIKKYVVELFKYYEDYKANIGNFSKYFIALKEDFFSEIRNSFQEYHKNFGELIENKFNKLFGNKDGKYLQIFAIILRKLKNYNENIFNYIKDLNEIIEELKIKYKKIESLKSEKLVKCLDLLKEFDSQMKIIQLEINDKYSNIKKSNGYSVDKDLNIKFVEIKNSFFKNFEILFSPFQEILSNNTLEIVKIKLKFTLSTIKSLKERNKTLKDLILELDRKYLKILSLEDNFERKESQEENIELDEQLNLDENNSYNKFQDEKNEKILLEKEKEKIEIEEIQNEMAKFLTKLLRTFFEEWSINDTFIEKVIKKLNTSFNKKRNPLFDEIIVKRVRIDRKGPVFKAIVPQKCDDFEVFITIILFLIILVFI